VRGWALSSCRRVAPVKALEGDPHFASVPQRFHHPPACAPDPSLKLWMTEAPSGTQAHAVSFSVSAQQKAERWECGVCTTYLQRPHRHVRLMTTSLGASKAAAQPPGCHTPVNTMVLSSTFSMTLVDCSPMWDALLAYSFFSRTWRRHKPLQDIFECPWKAAGVFVAPYELSQLKPAQGYSLFAAV